MTQDSLIGGIVSLIIFLLALVGDGKVAWGSGHSVGDHALVLGVLLDDDLELGGVDNGAALLSSLSLYLAHDCNDDVHQNEAILRDLNKVLVRGMLFCYSVKHHICTLTTNMCVLLPVSEYNLDDESFQEVARRQNAIIQMLSNLQVCIFDCDI